MKTKIGFLSEVPVLLPTQHQMVCILITEPPKPASEVQALVMVNLILQLLNAQFSCAVREKKNSAIAERNLKADGLLNFPLPVPSTNRLLI